MGGNDSKPQWKLTQLGLVFFLLCSVLEFCNQKFGNGNLRLFFSISGDMGCGAMVSDSRKTMDGGEVVRIWTIFSVDMETWSLCFALLLVSAPATEPKIPESSSVFSFTEKNMISLCATKGQKSYL
ncbi:hypothetical protein MRB53_014187 [Persea americana]|uniref:Uncharacterized protein n=1 Tax=Persea americana TaxID=3435 RepID=A0ACC2KAB1_PERAE|nr:hypothetical protein MRB53_014187 [Persea americana]